MKNRKNMTMRIKEKRKENYCLIRLYMYVGSRYNCNTISRLKISRKKREMGSKPSKTFITI